MATEFSEGLPRLGSALQEYDDEFTEQGPVRTDEELYWCERSDEALATAVKDKEHDYYEYALNHGHFEIWIAMLSEYYGRDPGSFAGFESAGIDFDGEEGELVRFRVNELHSYIRQTVTGATKERPAFKAGTLNTDYSAACQVDIVDTLANHVYETYFGEKRERMLVERGELFSTMWGWARWDAEGGEVSAVEQVDEMGARWKVDVPSGEPVARVKLPWDVISDPTIEDDDDHQFRIVRERRNKHELIRAYPEHEEHIRGATLRDETAYELSFAFDDGLDTDDDCIVKHLYHRADGVMPEGHYAIILGNSVLERKSLKELHANGEIPCIPYQPEPMVGTSFGYSEAWDLLVMQQMQTQVTSDIATNLSMVGRSVVVLPQGSEITPDQLSNGASALYVPSMEDKPEALNLVQIAPGAFQFLSWLQQTMQTLAGQNSVTRGQPSENIKSGQMAALFHAIALESGHIRGATFNEFRERMCMLLVDMMREHAQGQFLATVVGEDESKRLKYFTADVFKPVKRVFVETTNPMLRARAGQVEMANFLRGVPGAIRTPQQAIQAFTTGQVKPMYKSAEAEISQVQWENEVIRSGQAQVIVDQVPVMTTSADPLTGRPIQVPQIDPMTGQPAMAVQRRLLKPEAKPTDNPWVHVNEHMADFDPNEPPEVTQAREAHIEHHMRVYREVTPDLAAIRGFPPVGAAAPMPSVTSPDGGMSDRAKQEPGKMSAVDETGLKLPKPAGPPPEAAM